MESQCGRIHQKRSVEAKKGEYLKTTEEPTLRGFVARLQAKSAVDGEKLSDTERKYLATANRHAAEAE